MPPKVGSSALTACMNSAEVLDLISMSKTSIPANCLNKIPLPYITGLEAKGPLFPKPKTAVPFEITPTRFPLDV